MGRKGVSKRKPNQTKSKPWASGAASGSVSSVVKAAESQPVKSLDTEKTVASTRGVVKSSSDWKKKSKNG